MQMLNKIIFTFIFIFIYSYWDNINRFINPPPDFAKNHDEKVIIYTTSWCGYCAKARKLLEENNIDYFEYDIEKSIEGERQHNALGENTIPILLINGEVIVGYDPKRILRIIESMPLSTLNNISI
tara:strand:- start:363 stop:737 length:375 start_codon:yes stop_codon:yes gene_type:complete